MASTSSDDNAKLSQPPLFFKIFLPDNQILPIPQHFINNFDGVVFQNMLLQDSEGKFWMVELESMHGRLVIHKGWQKFVKAHDLKFGNLLLFKYSHGFVFHVKIFRNDCCLATCLTNTQRIAIHTSSSPTEGEILKFTKIFGVKMGKCLKLPSHVWRRCEFEAEEQIVLRTEKEGEACIVEFQEDGGNFYLGSGEVLNKFWNKINVQPKDKCEFAVHVTNDWKVKEIVIVNVSRFTTFVW